MSLKVDELLESTDFEAYENELKDLVKNDKNNWTKFYILMEKVEKDKLYKQKNFRSFTAWLKDFAIKNQIHESVLWNRKKAGRVYKEYQMLQAQRGIETLDIEKVNVSMDSLVLLDKIQKKAPALAAELVEKTINKEVTREDLRRSYKQIRDAAPPKKPGRKKKLTKEEEQAQKAEFEENTATAAKITQLLKSSKWLVGYEVKKKAFVVSEQQDKYAVFSEFRVYTGTTRKSRRIDVVVLENIEVKNKLHEVNIHGIEIKVARHDLINDTKYMEYMDFVNYLWLAVPKELVQDAEDTAPPSVGILKVNGNEIEKVREAERNVPLKITETLVVAALKMM